MSNAAIETPFEARAVYERSEAERFRAVVLEIRSGGALGATFQQRALERQRRRIAAQRAARLGAARAQLSDEHIRAPAAAGGSETARLCAKNKLEAYPRPAIEACVRASAAAEAVEAREGTRGFGTGDRVQGGSYVPFARDGGSEADGGSDVDVGSDADGGVDHHPHLDRDSGNRCMNWHFGDGECSTAAPVRSTQLRDGALRDGARNEAADGAAHQHNEAARGLHDELNADGDGDTTPWWSMSQCVVPPALRDGARNAQCVAPSALRDGTRDGGGHAGDDRGEVEQPCDNGPVDVGSALVDPQFHHPATATAMTAMETAMTAMETANLAKRARIRDAQKRAVDEKERQVEDARTKHDAVVHKAKARGLWAQILSQDRRSADANAMRARELAARSWLQRCLDNKDRLLERIDEYWNGEVDYWNDDFEFHVDFDSGDACMSYLEDYHENDADAVHEATAEQLATAAPMPLEKSTYCWLHGLNAKPQYNGNCVQLVRYVRERERWECRPVNWECATPTIGVRAANLSVWLPASECVGDTCASTNGHALDVDSEWCDACWHKWNGTHRQGPDVECDTNLEIVDTPTNPSNAFALSTPTSIPTSIPTSMPTSGVEPNGGSTDQPIVRPSVSDAIRALVPSFVVTSAECSWWPFADADAENDDASVDFVWDTLVNPARRRRELPPLPPKLTLTWRDDKGTHVVHKCPQKNRFFNGDRYWAAQLAWRTYDWSRARGLLRRERAVLQKRASEHRRNDSERRVRQRRESSTQAEQHTKREMQRREEVARAVVAGDEGMRERERVRAQRKHEQDVQRWAQRRAESDARVARCESQTAAEALRVLDALDRRLQWICRIQRLYDDVGNMAYEAAYGHKPTEAPVRRRRIDERRAPTTCVREYSLSPTCIHGRGCAGSADAKVAADLGLGSCISCEATEAALDEANQRRDAAEDLRSSCRSFLRPKQRSRETTEAFAERRATWDAKHAIRCEGVKSCGSGRCNVRATMTYKEAAPLRAGRRFCLLHEPDPDSSYGVVRCAGTTSSGPLRCKVTSLCTYKEAEPLRRGEAYCKHHTWQGWSAPDVCVGQGCASSVDADVAADLGLEYCAPCKSSWRCVGGWCDDGDAAAWYEARKLVQSTVVRCEGVASNGDRCRVNSMHSHDGAEPLRNGGRFCAVHGACASVGRRTEEQSASVCPRTEGRSVR